VDAEVGSRAFVNEQERRLRRHDHLAAQLKDFVESSARYEPQTWVCRIVSAVSPVRRRLKR